MAAPLNGEYCGTCGAELALDGVCPACMLDRGWMTDEQPPLAAPNLSLRSFGDYELIEEIARGGMGVVYKARQRSLDRIVAVKMVLAGRLASASELKRFRAEAETAAKLQHPNIVAIHEVGEFEGQPFFSMDYVEGRSLAELAHNQPLPAKRAAAYLKMIAEAVEYAHSKGVLHRDLKPSNILIDQNDQPRITDFGLAKRLDDSALRTPHSALTITGQVLGSPNFMPPEQATGDRKAIGPASDVYSLGAVLYQLLTGRPPFMAETLTQTLRLVAETEPVSPRLLNPNVPRDLETICLKCLEKRSAFRYATSQALAEELGRYLRDEPILARPVSRVERARRWCGRNRALAATGAAAVLFLIGLAIGSPIATFRIDRDRVLAEQARQEEAALRKQAEANEKKATTEAAKSQQVAQLLKDMLRGVGPSVARGRDTALLQEILDQTAAHFVQDLRDQPAIEADLRTTLGEVYYAIGQDKQAEAMHRVALDLREKLFGDHSLATAESKHNLGLALYARAEDADAILLLRDALETRRGLAGDQSLAVAESLNSLGVAVSDRDLRGNAEAENLFREALAIRRQSLPAGHPDIALSLNNLARVLTAEGKDTEAEIAAQEALAIQRQLWGRDHPDLAVALHTLATVLLNQGRSAEAETCQREGLAVQRTLLGGNHRELAKSLCTLGQALAAQGKLADAEGMLREGLEILLRLFDPHHAILDWPRITLAQVLNNEGTPAEAEALYRETLVSLRRNHSPDVWLELSTTVGLADVLRGQGRAAEAKPLYREGIELASRLPASFRNSRTGWRWPLYGLVYTSLHSGEIKEAEALVQQAMATNAEAWVEAPVACEITIDVLAWQGKYREVEEFLTNTPALATLNRSAAVRRARGDLRASHGHWAEAAKDFVKALELEPDNVENYHRLAPTLVQSGQLEEYRHWCRNALMQFASTQIPGVAERVAKDSLMLPGSGEELTAACKMADVAVSAGTNHPGINWIRVTKALAEFRQGRWNSSIGWADQALANSGVPQRDAEAFLIQAMARWHLNQVEPARSALAKAREIVAARMPTFDDASPNEPWWDWVIVQALLKEASLLLDASETQGASGGARAPAAFTPSTAPPARPTPLAP